MDAQGKVVWITGASSGIGEALAYAYSRTGATLILSARSVEKLEDVRKRCTNPKAHILAPLDLTDAPSLETACREVLAQMGRIDILVNNGGVSQRSFASETALDVDRRIMETNFFGTVALTKAVLPSMLADGSGHIVVISSLMGKFGTPLRSSYSASKHALHGFFDCLRAEVWSKGVSVTIVCPGFIRTNLSYSALTADGSLHGVMDDAQACGMLPDVCAGKIVTAVGKKRHEVYIGGREVMGIYVKRLFPALFDRIIRKVKVT